MISATRFRDGLGRFHRSESGNLTIEMVFMIPLLLVISLGLLTFFDAFKAKTTAARTATVVSDMVSREKDPITPEYLDGVSGVMQAMIMSDEAPEFRLTAFTWDESDDQYEVRWSKWRGNRIDHTNQTLNFLSNDLPSLKDGQIAVLLETWVDYKPLTKWGLDEGGTFTHRLVAAQRFVPQICYMDSLDDDYSTALC